MDSLTDTLRQILIWAPPLIMAITFHEAAHGFAANRYGDDTAKRLGRLTLNPLAHIDRFGTVILPLILLLLPGGFIFGYAKPVPVQVQRLNDPRWDMAKVAFAGPAMNFLLAIVCVLLVPLAMLLPKDPAIIVLQMLDIAILFNILLGLFNLIPLPPLDGGRVLTAILPRHLSQRLQRLERVGIFIVLGIFFLVPMLARQVGLRVEPFQMLIMQPTQWIAKSLVALVA